MPAPDAITHDRLAKLIGTPRCPALLDVRPDADRSDDRRLIPGARLLVVEGAGHSSTIEAPDAVTGALRAFLEAH